MIDHDDLGDEEFKDGADAEPRDLSDLIKGLTDESTHQERPFTGQPHTHFGEERGKIEVRGLRFRDLADCAARAFVRSCPSDDPFDEDRERMRRRAEGGTLNYNDLFELDLGPMDPLAFIQNLCCEVERAMGIDTRGRD